MRLRLSILTACALASLGALAGPAPAVLDGKPDREAHKYVGVVLGSMRCSGALVAPDLVVTAAHCVFGAPQILFTLENPAPSPSAAPQAYVTGTATIAPGFPIGFPFTNDVAVVKLSAPYPDAHQFAKLPKLGVVDDMSEKEHKTHLVGFGLLGFTDGGAPIGNAPPWTRYRKHVSLLSDSFHPSFATVEPAAVCKGDSGAPLVRGSHVVAIASLTERPDCTGRALAYRLDTVAAQQFLAAQGVPLHPASG